MPEIKNLVLEGGGVRGVALLGAVRALTEAGHLDKIEKVAGTSAGAITALLLSIGCTNEELTELIGNTDISSFKDPATFKIFNLFANYGVCKGEAFYRWIEEQVEKKLGRKDATFMELHNLYVESVGKKVPTQTGKLRELYLIGTNLSTGYAEIFSYEHTPNMPIAAAVRISMSIPLFFEAVKASKDANGQFIVERNGRLKAGRDAQVFVDGGALLNYAITIFDKDHSPNLNTIGIKLDTEEEISILQEGNKPRAERVNSLFKYIERLANTLLNVETNNHRSSGDDVRTVYINTLEVGSTEFSLTMEQKNSLTESGYKAVRKFLLMYDNNIVHPYLQAKQDRYRLNKADLEKISRKAVSMSVQEVGDQEINVQWILPNQEKAEGDRLKNVQRANKYFNRLVKQGTTKFLEMAKIPSEEPMRYVINLTADSTVKKILGKVKDFFPITEHQAITSSSLIPIISWPQPEQLVSIAGSSEEKELYNAASNNNLAKVDELLLKGVRPDYCDKFGDTALHRVVEYGYSALIQRLIKGGAKLNVANKYGDTPLNSAVSTGNLPIISTLLGYRADPNHRNSLGNTALHIAIKEWKGSADDQLKAISLLLKNGANLYITNTEGLSAIPYAEKYGKPEVVELLQKEEQILSRIRTTSTSSLAR